MQWRLSIKNALAVVALLVLAWLGYKMWYGAAKNPAQRLSTTEVSRGDIGRMLQLSGTVKPLHTLKIISLVGARIQAICVKEGELVNKGQILLEFDTDELKAKLASARVSHLKAESRLKELENWRFSPSYVDIKANLDINQVELEAKEQEYSQNQQLYQAKAISKQDLDRSKLDLDRSRAELAKSQAQIIDSENKYGPRALQEVQAEMVVTEVALREARENLSNNVIRAPETGIIHFARAGGEGPKGGSAAETALSPRSSVAPGQVLFTIQSYKQLAVEVYVNEYDILRVHPGQQCFISLPALPGAMFEGRVDSISTEFVDKLTAFKVLCRILPSAGRQNQSEKEQGEETNSPQTSPPKRQDRASTSEIIVGMSANVSIPLEGKTDVLLVPISALVRKNGTSGVFVMDYGKPVFTQVKTGIVSKNEAEIVEGLEEGQEILEEVPGKLLENPAFSGGE